MDLEERLQRRANVETERSRVLVTLLFTDLVGSTERARAARGSALARAAGAPSPNRSGAPWIGSAVVRSTLSVTGSSRPSTPHHGPCSCGSGLTRSLAQLRPGCARGGPHRRVRSARDEVQRRGGACRGSGRPAGRTSRGARHRNGQGGRCRRGTEVLRTREPRTERVAGRLAALRGGRDSARGSTDSRQAFGPQDVRADPRGRSRTGGRTGARQMMRRVSPRRPARAHSLEGLG